MINNKIKSFLTVALATVSLFFAACEDDVSSIGGSISSSEVTIRIDSLKYDLKAKNIEAPSVDSRSAYTLLGSISVPEYGELDCSFVTQFLPAESISLPDTINADKIDSVKMILTVPKQYVTGDTLALQQIRVYSLTKQLPADISSSFNPDGYFNPSSPLATRSYNLSGYTYNDTSFISSRYANIHASLPLSLGREVVDAYKDNPDIFVWPQEFSKYWPGVYVTPSFGKGCIAAIQNTSVYIYYPYTSVTTEINDEGESQLVYTQKADSLCVFTTAPEVLSSVNISYRPSKSLQGLVEEGRSIVTTPGGYTVSFHFPAKEILSDFWEEKYDLGVINNMVFSIPAKPVSNSFGIGMTPALLMVKSSELDSYFSEGKLPDNQSSFYSIYSSDTAGYTFSSMRQYIVDLRNKGEANITDEDVDFTLVPVTVSTEEYTDPSTGVAKTQVTAITPYILMPTMVELDTENALVVFTFSSETLL